MVAAVEAACERGGGGGGGSTTNFATPGVGKADGVGRDVLHPAGRAPPAARAGGEVNPSSSEKSSASEDLGEKVVEAVRPRRVPPAAKGVDAESNDDPAESDAVVGRVAVEGRGGGSAVIQSSFQLTV